MWKEGKGTEKKEKKKKKKKNFPREILENSSDIEKTPLCDNDPNSNEGPSGSVAKRKRKRLPGKNINKGETRRKKKTGSADGAENTETRKSSKRVKFSEKVEVFPLLDVTDIDKENKEKGLVRGKRFSLEEDVIVKDAVFKFIKEHDLGDDGIEMVSADVEPVSPRHHAKNGPDWRPLADELGKYRIHVKDAWRRMCLPNMKKGRWSKDEYQQLFDLVNMDLRMKISEEKKSKHGMTTSLLYLPWASRVLGVKWYEQLESRLVREDKWATSDDIRLLDALLTMDFSSLEEVDWDSLLDHRPGDLCRKRWCGMVNHLGEHRNKSFADQVEVLSKRYCGDVLEARAAYEERTPVD
ncbi:hypothetical protein IFM89_034916 [Coptis chinensis]|uniref:Myb-like domain-containing protein n=1 Tax=Coptis chinensis TaxID=261450 RepID=A0A835I850_9MAGN|nr:hypothetical protein IFM89_034916 [Coptis chinensis]